MTPTQSTNETGDEERVSLIDDATPLNDSDATLRITFAVRTTIQSPIGVDAESPYVETVKSPMPAKTDVIYTEPIDGKSVLTPAGYAITFDLDAMSRDVLEDKFETAFTYLDQIVTDDTRSFNVVLTFGGKNPRGIYDDFEEVIQEFGQDHFGVVGKKTVLGTNKFVTVAFRGGDGVLL